MKKAESDGPDDVQRIGYSYQAEFELAVFGDPLQTRPNGAVQGVDLDALIASLQSISGYAQSADRACVLGTVAAVAATEADRLANRLARPNPEPRDATVAQQYFRIRTAELPADWSLWHCLKVIQKAVEDLVEAPTSGSDLDRIAQALVASLSSYAVARGHSGAVEPHRPTAVVVTDVEMWWRRWIVGHQLHAMLNVHAAWALADAAEGLRRADRSRSLRAVDAAAQIVEGFGPARAQSLAVPPDFYEHVLRPTMLPPLTTTPLTGRMHVEYRGYRARLDEVLALLPERSADLAATHPMLALARERLVEADLIEAERHVTSVEPLVRGSRSLIQTAKSVDNAVSALRRIRHRRARRAARFVRYPDTFIVGAANPGDSAGHDGGPE